MSLFTALTTRHLFLVLRLRLLGTQRLMSTSNDPNGSTVTTSNLEPLTVIPELTLWPVLRVNHNYQYIHRTTCAFAAYTSSNIPGIQKRSPKNIKQRSATPCCFALEQCQGTLSNELRSLFFGESFWSPSGDWPSRLAPTG